MNKNDKKESGVGPVIIISIALIGIVILLKLLIG